MEVQVKIKLKPFTVPNYVIVEADPRPRQEGYREAEKFHLSALDSNTLSALCDEFRDEVFRKAKKDQPTTQRD